MISESVFSHEDDLSQSDKKITLVVQNALFDLFDVALVDSKAINAMSNI
jgi:hypothetical protein